MTHSASTGFEQMGETHRSQRCGKGLKAPWSAWEIGAMVAGFVIFWPIGLVALFLKWKNGEMWRGSSSQAAPWAGFKKPDFGSWQQKASLRLCRFRQCRLRRLQARAAEAPRRGAPQARGRAEGLPRLRGEGAPRQGSGRVRPLHVGAAPVRSSRGDLKHATDTEKPGFGRAFLFQGSVSRGRGAVSGGSTGRRAGGRRSPKTAGLGAARGAVMADSADTADPGFDHHILRAADQHQMLDIVAAHQDQPPHLVELMILADAEALAAPAAHPRADRAPDHHADEKGHDGDDRRRDGARCSG